MASRSTVEERERAYVSTGHLPDPDTVQSLVNEASASQTNFRNRSIARLLESYDRIYCDVKEATGFGTFAPPLDTASNSVRGQLAAKFLSQRLAMDLFVSQRNNEWRASR